MSHVLGTRNDFEAALRGMSGLEFVVAFRPQDFYGEPQISQGLWVIRKQNRRKVSAGEDEVAILNTYFVVGENIYQAPSLSNIVSSRMVCQAHSFMPSHADPFPAQLSVTLALSKLLDTSASLPTYTPALGHRYFPPLVKPTADPSSTVAQSAREESLAPETLPQPSTPRDMPAAQPAANIADSKDVQILFESFNQFLKYGNEYMDENPLIGEPGSFVFSSSKQHLQAQQMTAQRTQANKAMAKQSNTPQPTVPSTPQPVPEPTVTRKIVKPLDKLATAGPPKPKRRKSKAPTSPSSPLNPASPS